MINMDELIKQGWRYIDPPTWFSPDMWEHFQSTIGERGKDFHILIQSSGGTGDSAWIRGQFLISPQGMTNMAEYSKRKKEERE